nr:MAG TPA: hypothetical protein [Inoviridae sp.]
MCSGMDTSSRASSVSTILNFGRFRCYGENVLLDD